MNSLLKLAAQGCQGNIGRMRLRQAEMPSNSLAIDVAQSLQQHLLPPIFVVMVSHDAAIP
eukprot:m.178561 g.178561  ORF g.178561 m.178561 type:complete len:60 (+) comp16591_c0_seq1:1558-1737(+)